MPYELAAAGIGALGSIAGSVLGKSDNGPGLGGLVRRARRLGLHPLSVLGSPIAGNFATPSQNSNVAGEAARAFADNVATGLREYGSAQQRRREYAEAQDRLRRQDELNSAETVARIGLLNAQASDLLRDGMGGVRDHSVASRSNSVRPLPDPGGNTWPGGTRKAQPLDLGFMTIQPGIGGGRASSEDVEEQYGDVGEWAYGGPRMVTDTLMQTTVDDVTRFMDALDTLRRNRAKYPRRSLDWEADLFGSGISP